MSDEPCTPSSRPRYSAEPLPPYSYVPGLTPHPLSDPRGHMYGHALPSAPPLDPERWRESTAYLQAVDLFNHGFYWEAHEAWESLWHAAGRRGVAATWLKALIKLAAAGVKAREGNPSGVERHARRALELIGLVRAELPADATRYGGVDFRRLADAARALAADARSRFASPDAKLMLPYGIELSNP